MQNRKIKRFIYRVRHDYLTMNNVVLVIAVVVAASWAWASVQAVQRNYVLQHEVDDKQRQEKLVELETQNLQYQQHYYQSSEYLSLEAKRRLGLADPGERVLVLPANSGAAKALDADTSSTSVATATASPPPLEQWIDFLFGGSHQSLQKNS